MIFITGIPRVLKLRGEHATLLPLIQTFTCWLVLNDLVLSRHAEGIYNFLETRLNLPYLYLICLHTS